MKRCSKCGEEKPLDEFYKNRSAKDGLTVWCKPCDKTAAAAYYAANKEKVQQQARVRARKRYRELRQDPEWRAKEAQRHRQRRAQNPQYHRQWCEQNAEHLRQAHLMRYGLSSEEEFQARLASQGNACAVCGTDEPGLKGWQIDHDHTCCPKRARCGQCTRGILCMRCNLGLGHFKDDPQRLEAAIAYLKKYERKMEAVA